MYKVIQHIDLKTSVDRKLKKAIWLYFFLLIFEGALRKWFLPSLSDALLVVRDPLAIWILYYSWKHKILKKNIFLISMFGLGSLGIITALLFGHSNIFVALFGARIYLLHFPLIFIIGGVFNERDVINLGRIMIYLAIPMTILIALQFYSPQSAWVNRGVGGNLEGAGFAGAMGYFRPPGTFSFTMGTTLFYSFLAVYIFYFWFSKAKINNLLLTLSTFCLIASIPLAISRALFYSICLTFLFVLFSLIFNREKLQKLLLVTGVLIVFGALLSNFEFFSTPLDVIVKRFEQANEVEGGVSNSLVDRIFGYMFRGFVESRDVPFFGYGIGMGTNVGSQLMTGDRKFLIAEMEYGRIIGEMGLVMGSGIILVRLLFAIKLSLISFKSLKDGNLLPWLLLSVGLLILIQGQWASTMNLGFTVVIIGLAQALLKDENISTLRKEIY
ncbi:hypothetical protein SAMN05421766_101880 [Zobellia uliginosa]|uniref:O-Antigen ligase n=1 Tax=Zobellia uliginosa TaxID=143224 RepID=A0ABY1KJU4_9FLAO|nr:hypothetical protein [Zobellia uliginosa]SIS42710.1 hypothetical protein SAMN05421766_101880 [Zobellia uliginosa]